MRVVYYLATCDTCKRILKELSLKEKGFVLHEIKSQPINTEQLESLKKMTGSYESLFSKVSRKYKELGLSAKQLSESEMKELILSEYTFLKRPVIVFDGKIFVGNSKNVIAEAAKALRD